MKIAKQKKVLIALSGGIDSAVSAYLLQKQGYLVEAAFMKNWSSTEGLLINDCPWLQDRQDALRVAAFLGIPLRTLDFEKQYQKTVMSYFFTEYKKGRTPNPDVLCNKEIKFKLLYNWAMKNGFDFLATGHYAKINKLPPSPSHSTGSGQALEKEGGRKTLVHNLANGSPSFQKRGQGGVYNLMRSTDEFKDQTYFIYNIKTEQLQHLIFPIGGMKKFAVRALARKLKLPNAEKRESMGLCFVGKIRLKDFLEQKIKPKKGKIVNPDGKTIGHHPGLHNFTLGQRQGIAVGGSGPYYVFRKDLRTNILYVTNNAEDERLKIKEIELHSVNWVSERIREVEKERISLPLLGRYRHQGELVPLNIVQISRDHYKVTFKTPQKAVASGQSLVLYKGKECVGGGVIA